MPSRAGLLKTSNLFLTVTTVDTTASAEPSANPSPTALVPLAAPAAPPRAQRPLLLLLEAAQLEMARQVTPLLPLATPSTTCPAL